MYNWSKLLASIDLIVLWLTQALTHTFADRHISLFKDVDSRRVYKVQLDRGHLHDLINLPTTNSQKATFDLILSITTPIWPEIWPPVAMDKNNCPYRKIHTLLCTSTDPLCPNWEGPTLVQSKSSTYYCTFVCACLCELKRTKVLWLF